MRFATRLQRRCWRLGPSSSSCFISMGAAYAHQCHRRCSCFFSSSSVGVVWRSRSGRGRRRRKWLRLRTKWRRVRVAEGLRCEPSSGGGEQPVAQLRGLIGRRRRALRQLRKQVRLLLGGRRRRQQRSASPTGKPSPTGALASCGYQPNGRPTASSKLRRHEHHFPCCGLTAGAIHHAKERRVRRCGVAIKGALVAISCRSGQPYIIGEWYRLL